MFEKVLKEVMGNWADKSYSQLYLYGPSGFGKSHLLAAVVLCLIWQGERVVYIPDCREALNDSFRYIQEALLFAFHNDNDSCDAITAAVQVDDLINFMQHQPNDKLYVIVDQRNALEVIQTSKYRDLFANEKVKVFTTLQSIGFRQKFIFSASAGEHSHRSVDERQTGIRVFHIDTGMTKVCSHFFELPCLTSLG